MVNKNNSLLDFLKILTLPVAATVVMSVWFFGLQGRGDNFAVPVILGLEGQLGVIEMSISAMLTHYGMNHFIGNSIAMFSYLFMFSIFQKNRWIVPQLIILLIPNLYLISVHTNAVGISGFSSSIFGCVLMLVLYILYLSFVDQKSDRGTKLAIGSVLIVMLFLSSQYAFDVLVLLDVVSIENPGVAKVLVGDIPPGYNEISSKVHSIGFLMGVAVSCVSLLVESFSDLSLIREMNR